MSTNSPSQPESTREKHALADVEHDPAPTLGHGRRGRQIRGFKWFILLFAIYSSMFIFALDNTVTANLVPVITNEFHTVDLLPWLSVGFMLGGYVALLPVGKVYEKYDAKWVYLVSIVLFLGFSALCGGAPNMTAMIIGRVFLGVFGAALYCGIMTLVALHTDEAERPTYFSITAVVWSVGTVLGPVIGGAFDLVNWRWSFYINLVIGGVFTPVVLIVLPTSDRPPSPGTPLQRAKSFDFAGTVLLVAFSICLVMAINFGGVLYAWNSGSIIALFVVGIVLAIAFGLQQKFAWLTTRENRIFPGQLLHRKEAIVLSISMLVSNAASFIPIYYIPIYFQFSMGDSPLMAAVHLIPLIIIFSFFNLSQGFLMMRIGYYWPWFLCGGALLLAGNAMLYMIDAHTTRGYIYGAEVLIGTGMGLCNQAPFSVIQSVVPPADAGLGVPLIMFAQYTGITAGLSIAGAVFINVGLRDLHQLLPSLPQSQLSSILSGASGDALKGLPEEMLDATVDIIVNNLRKTSIPAFFGGAVVVIISVFLNKRKVVVGKDAAMIAG